MFGRNAIDERSKITFFLRQYAYLRALAQLIDDGVHLLPEKEAREYALQKGILLR